VNPYGKFVVWCDETNLYYRGGGEWDISLNEAQLYDSVEEAEKAIPSLLSSLALREHLHAIPVEQHAEEVLFIAFIDTNGVLHRHQVQAYAARNGNMWEWAAKDPELLRRSGLAHALED
jgi:hypothetical protein